MELNIAGTPQTSSGSSSEALSSCTPNDMELEDGSECGWRHYDDDTEPRPIFYMGDDDVGRFANPHVFQRNLESQMIRVGICAMAKKTNSKPMKEILGRLGRFEHLQIIVFSEAMITQAPVEEWPIVDALISFFSTGFPLQKAIQYKNLHKPFVVNDLEAQYSLKDRREVYKILAREGIPHPRYAVMNRDDEDRGEFSENEDAIEVNGTSFQRPFVEKPVNAEDHNIYIYFPLSAGGGSQRLFRKVGSRSSVYSTISRVRKIGSYIYEDFMPTDGTDVKVYTVGPDYAHAEARKSPALDGKVERDKDGKEIRYPVLLTAAEKIIARKVSTAFKQTVCGFDLLRTGGKSYVCDVNGFSFVKNSTKYYDDCANVLGTTIVRALAPQLHIPLVLGAAPEDIPVVPTTSGSMMELRCVIAIIRHGDRTPKQKMKMEVKHKKFFQLFEKYHGYKKGHLKLKKPKQLQEVLDIARDLLNEKHDTGNPEVLEKKAKLRQLKLVLEMYEFSGINRKIQLKYQPLGRPPESSDDEFPREPSLVLIVKWGGELTPAGKYQAEDLGKAFRTLYPGGQGEFETPGLGFLRLHSTFRHDLKIYASDEGRVQMTAAAFTKGLLALEGELTPILVSMVKSANTNGLLDKEGETSKYQHIVKERMMEILNKDQDFSEEDLERLIPTGSQSLKLAVNSIQNPRQMCDKVFTMVQEIVAKIRTLKMELKSRDLKLYHGESWELLIRRWAKLEKDFKLKSGQYDISKIPDIYDCIKYDLQHNQATLQFSRAEDLFTASKALADIVIPQEYGITVEEKLHISQSICTPLMRKIHNDLNQGFQGCDEQSTRLNSKYSKGVASPERFVRTRLYFTSESHIHSLLNMLRYGGLCDEVKDEQWKKAMTFLGNTPELNYMTQINIMMFEDPTKDPTSHERFHVELHFSPGAYLSSDKSVVNPVSSGYRTSFLARQMPKREKVTESVVVKSEAKEGVMQDVIAEDDDEEEMTSGETVGEPDIGGMSVGMQPHGEAMPADMSVEPPAEDVGEPSEHLEELPAEIGHIRAVKNVHCEADVGNVDRKLEVPDSLTLLYNQTVPDNETEVLETRKALCILEDVVVIRESTDILKQSVEHGPTSTNLIIKVDDEVVIKTFGDVVNCVDQSVDVNKDEDITVDGNINTSEQMDIECAITENKPDIIQTELGGKVEDICKSPAEGSGAEDVFVADHDTVRSDEGIEDRTVMEEDHAHVFDEHFEASDEDTHKTITDEEQLLKKKGKNVPQPHSPDPEIPEWDWGESACQDTSSTATLTDGSLHKLGAASVTKAATSCPATPSSSTEMDTEQLPRVRSKPIIIKCDRQESRPRTGSFESAKTYAEEKRSRSLEDREGADTCLAMMEKHYLTIHLPINKDSHHSFSSLLYLNPEAFKDSESLPTFSCHWPGSCSAPDLFVYTAYDMGVNDADPAFDGFNMVPSLKPLETLHNNLTMRDMDAFLSRATTTKFFTPVSSPMYTETPLPSPKCPELSKAKGSGASVPSSGSSSAGPSSPLSATTPIDFISKLRFCITNAKSQQVDSADIDAAEMDKPSEKSKCKTIYLSGTDFESRESTQDDGSQDSRSQLLSKSGKDCDGLSLIMPSVIQTDGRTCSTVTKVTPTAASENTTQPITAQPITSQPIISPGCVAPSLGVSVGHQSAFKTVTRSSNQRSAFQVTQVSEESLNKNKTEQK